MRLYLDTAPIIYMIEQSPLYATAVERRLQIPTVEIVVSELSRLECRVKPMRESDTALLTDYDQFFAESAAEIVPITREIIDRATEIRARYGFKTPDAIHLAAAVAAACDVFLTNDYRLDRFAELAIERV